MVKVPVLVGGGHPLDLIPPAGLVGGLVGSRRTLTFAGLCGEWLCFAAILGLERPPAGRFGEASTSTTPVKWTPQSLLSQWVCHTVVLARQTGGRSNQRRCSKSADTRWSIGSLGAGVAAASVALASTR